VPGWSRANGSCPPRSEATGGERCDLRPPQFEAGTARLRGRSVHMSERHHDANWRALIADGKRCTDIYFFFLRLQKGMGEQNALGPCGQTHEQYSRTPDCCP